MCGSNSLELAPARPHTSRANSITAQCRPRQSPRNGTSCSRAKPAAAILPSIPRMPNPPGITMPSRPPQAAFGEQTLGVVGRDPVDLHLRAAVEAAVLQRLDDREVGVGQVDVLADEPDAHRLGAPPPPARPASRHVVEVGLVLGEVEHPADVVVEALVVQHQRDLVERRARRRTTRCPPRARRTGSRSSA